MFSSEMIPYWIIMFCMLVPITIWYIKNNEKTNLTKSSAFIERDGVIYYIRLGYTLNYQQPGVPFEWKKVGLAKQNMKNTKHIQEIREDKNTFSKALTDIF